VPPEIAEDETHQVQRVGTVRVELRRAAQRRERLLVQPAVVEDLADIEIDHRAVWIQRESALQPLLRLLEAAVQLFGKRELHHRANVVRVVLQELGELGHRLGELSEEREGAAKLPACITVRGSAPEALAQIGDAPVVVACVEIRDLEVALRDLHLGVELERAHERGCRLGVQPLVVIQDAEVVVRTGVRRVDPPGE
jgi:hypothetical protein